MLKDAYCQFSQILTHQEHPVYSLVSNIMQIGAQTSRSHPQVIVPPHPLVSHWLAVMRNASTPSPMFRNACSELGRLLIYEAVREFLPTVEGVVDTPLGPADVKCVDPTKPIKVSV